MKKFAGVLLGVLALVMVPHTPVHSEPNDPVGLTVAFYDWYLHQHGQAGYHLAQQKQDFSSDLYGKLQAVYRYQSTHHEAVLDFDPFDNAQMEATGYHVGQVEVRFTTARVPILLDLGRGGHSSLTVVLNQDARRQWTIGDLVYPGMEKGKKNWSLDAFLRDQLKSIR